MKLERYLKESKMGKLPEKIERVAYLNDDPAELHWKIKNAEKDDRKYHKIIEDISYKELSIMKRKKILDFHEDDFDTWGTGGDYSAVVRLRSYDDKKLKSELRKLKFKVIG